MKVNLILLRLKQVYNCRTLIKLYRLTSLYSFFVLLFQVNIGQRDGISPTDARQMNLLYQNCRRG